MKMAHIAASACIAAFACSSGPAQTITIPGYFVETVITGLDLPTTMAFIGDDELLVLEKNTGKVKHYLNSTFQGTALDLIVANNGERGLLGICLHPDFAQNGLVFLYYSNGDEKGGTWLDNRVERFVWDGAVLTYESTIIVFPFDPLFDQFNGPWHNAGILRIGPDEKLYIITGDLGRGALGFAGAYRTIEQNGNNWRVAGVGGIHRLNLDGSIPTDNPFFYHKDDRIKTYISYGNRNSFGFAFDPLTGRLWETENGPEVYDELNVIDFGFNGGWTKIMGPDYRDAEYVQNLQTAYDAEDLIYLKGAYYGDPVFSWLDPIGVTAIQFLSSIKFGQNERGNVLIGDVNTRQLYLFEVNEARDGVVLLPGTEDGVADTDAERDQYAVGSGWGITTDLQLGPDGYIYTVSLTLGSIFRIRPEMDPFVPESFTVFRGLLLSGGLPDLFESDDSRLVVQTGQFAPSTQPPVQIEVTGTSPTETTSELRFRFEGMASRAFIERRISLYNYVTQSYEELHVGMAATSDEVIEIVVTTNASRFVEPGTRQVKSLMTWRAAAISFFTGWNVGIDQTIWTVRVQ